MNITYTPIGSGEYHLRVNGRTVAHATRYPTHYQAFVPSLGADMAGFSMKKLKENVWNVLPDELKQPVPPKQKPWKFTVKEAARFCGSSLSHSGLRAVIEEIEILYPHLKPYQRGDAIVQTWAEANAQWDHSPGRQWKKWLAENGPVIQLPKVDYDHLEATGEVRYQSAAA
jgi:hypothetical protein